MLKPLAVLLCLGLVSGCQKEEIMERTLVLNADCGVGTIKIEEGIIYTPIGAMFRIIQVERGHAVENDVYSVSFNPSTKQLFLFRQFNEPKKIEGAEILGEVKGEITPSVVFKVAVEVKECLN